MYERTDRQTDRHKDIRTEGHMYILERTDRRIDLQAHIDGQKEIYTNRQTGRLIGTKIDGQKDICIFSYEQAE